MESKAEYMTKDEFEKLRLSQEDYPLNPIAANELALRTRAMRNAEKRVVLENISTTMIANEISRRNYVVDDKLNRLAELINSVQEETSTVEIQQVLKECLKVLKKD